MISGKNPVFTVDGSILLEIEHPQFGWMPYLASPVDPEAYGQEIYARAISREFGDIEPYVEPVVPVPTLDEMIAAYKAAVQKHLDDAAKAKGYDDIVSACGYAGCDNEFRAEGESFVVWRAKCWKYCYAELDKVTSGQRPVPTIEQILGELPERDLP